MGPSTGRRNAFIRYGGRHGPGESLGEVSVSARRRRVVTTLFWHDYETSGADPRHDRPMQFAGQRTDLDLNPIGDPFVLYCRPAADCLPHPEACLLTGITPQAALDKGVNESEFISRVHDELSRPGTCGVGYNTLRFDDEITRHTLYRNFFDPYAREWQNGNSRWDIIDMVRMCHALRPEGLLWPRRDDGAPSFRLGDLASANGLLHESAHDALSDVHATIALARLVRARQPKLYDWLFNLRDKRRVRALLDIEAHTPLVHASGRISSIHASTSLIAPLAEHPVNKNAVLCYDLRFDPEPFFGLDEATLSERLFTSAEALGEGVQR
ncbi:MAG: exodeoxyribonuclease I, partial [Gammaproteobacteria bacterium]|nr:exodeoxyribonuclease I [Gammaproteobacteria bacterium]